MFREISVSAKKSIAQHVIIPSLNERAAFDGTKFGSSTILVRLLIDIQAAIHV